jgi:hypothetical protein
MPATMAPMPTTTRTPNQPTPNSTTLRARTFVKKEGWWAILDSNQ